VLAGKDGICEREIAFSGPKTVTRSAMRETAAQFAGP
jgi:hypothetical protein